MLALRLDCSKAALTTSQKVLPNWKLVELKMLDFSDRTRTGISFLTSAADYLYLVLQVYFTHQKDPTTCLLLFLHPEEPFTIFEHQNPPFYVLELNKISPSSDRKDLKLWKSRSRCGKVLITGRHTKKFQKCYFIYFHCAFLPVALAQV